MTSAGGRHARWITAVIHELLFVVSHACQHRRGRFLRRLHLLAREGSAVSPGGEAIDALRSDTVWPRMVSLVKNHRQTGICAVVQLVWPRRRGLQPSASRLLQRRTVPLPPWLAARMADYLAQSHPRAHEPTAPLWPNRALGGARCRGCRAIAPLDYTEPCDMGAFYNNLLRPDLEAVGLQASRPATKDTPAVRGVRLHDYADLRVMPMLA